MRAAGLVALAFGLWSTVVFSVAADARPSQNFTLGGLKVTAWLPAAQAKPAPVIVFSHGFHGCATQTKFLMEALSDAGYAVFAPDHADAACGNLLKWMNTAQEPFAKPEQWSEDTYRVRDKDIEILIDMASRDPRFAAFDWKTIGLAGHSLGGYTALGLAGGWNSWKDPHVKAVLALSPYATPYILNHTLKNIAVPVMYQGGTRDFGITPFIKKGDGAYQQTNAPKYFVELDGAGHFAWTDLNHRYVKTIDAYSIAFFDTYLKGKPFSPALMQKPGDVSMLEMETR